MQLDGWHNDTGRFEAHETSIQCFDHVAHRDRLTATPHQVDQAWTTLGRIMSREGPRYNHEKPCEEGGRLYSADRTDSAWGESEIATGLSVASSHIKLALVHRAEATILKLEKGTNL